MEPRHGDLVPGAPACRLTRHARLVSDLAPGGPVSPDRVGPLPTLNLDASPTSTLSGTGVFSFGCRVLSRCVCTSAGYAVSRPGRLAPATPTGLNLSLACGSHVSGHERGCASRAVPWSLDGRHPGFVSATPPCRWSRISLHFANFHLSRHDEHTSQEYLAHHQGQRREEPGMSRSLGN